jgi:hypothetical protein
MNSDGTLVEVKDGEGNVINHSEFTEEVDDETSAFFRSLTDEQFAEWWENGSTGLYERFGIDLEAAISGERRVAPLNDRASEKLYTLEADESDEEFGEVRDLTDEELHEFFRNYSNQRFVDSDREYEGESHSMWVEMETDGTARYSTDGGVTWNDGLPEGYTADEGGTGGFSVSVVHEIE